MKSRLNAPLTALGLMLALSSAHADYHAQGYMYLSPMPEAEYCSAQTRFVLVRFSNVPPSDVTNLLTSFITVTGASSGNHSGTTHIASDGRTVIFTMSVDFSVNELVTVALNPGLRAGASGTILPYQYRFVISTHLPDPGTITAPGDNPPTGSKENAFDSIGSTKLVDLDTHTNQAISSPGQKNDHTITNGIAYRGYDVRRVLAPPASSASTKSQPASSAPVNPGYPNASQVQLKPLIATLSCPVIMPNGVSVPTSFPQINITTNNNPDPEYIFIDNRGGGGKLYDVIFDNSGSPVWYQLMPDFRRDLVVQHNGMLTMLVPTGSYRFVGLNTNYVEVASYCATNGYGVDEHELQVLADGTYFLVALGSQTVDMSRYVSGGNPSASVTEQVIQSFTPAGELIFQWRAWDHFDIRDQQQLIDLTSSSFDFPHMNAIDIDTDGHFLLSSRSLSEITKINRDTGEIIWRLGGAHNQFTFVNDSLNGPRNQHAVRMVATNRYTMFDNGDLHSPSVSRGLEYRLDPTNMTATLVWQYPPTPTTSLYSFYMGNVQRLPNGNTLINWAVGNLPKLTEVRPDGTIAYEMNWADGYEAYRVWRCPWQGMALKPNLVIEPYADKLTLIFNKFGDTNVAFYRIYGGITPQPTNVLATTPITMANLRTLQNQTQYYFRVTAVSRAGTESDYSDEQSIFVNIIRPGQIMVANSDFSLGTNSWIWTNSGTASATWSIVSGASYIHVISPGTALSDIQLRQAGLKLVQGNQYVLEFDAWASAPRLMETRLGQDQSPWTAYEITSPSLTPVRQHFSYPFVMTSATDLNARLMFNLGVSTRDVYLDNVSVWMVAPGDFNRDRYVGFNDLSVFVGQWLRQDTGLTPDLNGDGSVNFNDFKMLGDNWSGGMH